MILSEKYPLPPVNKKEIFRYAGIRGNFDAWEDQLDRVLSQCEKVFDGRVCWEKFPVKVNENKVDMSFASVESSNLSKNLSGCSEIMLFAATVGIGIDRLIRKCSADSISDSVWLQAIGSERIEALCNTFCEQQRRIFEDRGSYFRPRFSPGYGDLSLDLQKEIFEALNCSAKIGLYLTEAKLMVPGKSVTAIIGISDTPCNPASESCSFCEKTDCAFRKI